MLVLNQQIYLYVYVVMYGFPYDCWSSPVNYDQIRVNVFISFASLDLIAQLCHFEQIVVLESCDFSCHLKRRLLIIYF